MDDTSVCDDHRAVDKFFKITERGSTVGREVRGGVVTFFTMAYIIVLNPLIIGFAKDADGKFVTGNAPDLPMIAAATALVAGVMTILMGVVANFPLALATGLGLNAFVAYSIASGMTWQDALGLVVLEGLVILVLVLTGFRRAVFHAVPPSSRPRSASASGSSSRSSVWSTPASYDASRTPRTPRSRCSSAPPGRSTAGPCWSSRIGSMLMVTLYVLKVRAAILISILATTVLAVIVEAIAKVGPTVNGDKVNPNGWNLNVPALPDKIVGVPDFGLLGHFSLFGALRAGRRPRRRAVRLHADARRLLRHHGHDDRDRRRGGTARQGGVPPNSQRILVVDSVAAAAGGAAGVSSNTSYIESASGVGEGARTGLASVVTGRAVPALDRLRPAGRDHPERGGGPGADASSAS